MNNLAYLLWIKSNSMLSNSLKEPHQSGIPECVCCYDHKEGWRVAPILFLCHLDKKILPGEGMSNGDANPSI